MDASTGHEDTTSTGFQLKSHILSDAAMPYFIPVSEWSNLSFPFDWHGGYDGNKLADIVFEVAVWLRPALSARLVPVEAAAGEIYKGYAFYWYSAYYAVCSCHLAKAGLMVACYDL